MQFRYIALLAVSTLALAACDDDEITVPNQTASVRFVNASATNATVNGTVAGTATASNIAFQSGSAACANVPAGTQTVGFTNSTGTAIGSGASFNFVAGQYLDIMLPQNRRRSFSIASTPGRDESLELHIRKVASGEFTQQLFEGMKEKTLLRVEGPLGQFWFRKESPRPALLIGGGTGYAPLRSMLRDLLDVGDRRPLHLYWGAQARQDLYEDEQVRALCAAHQNLRYTSVLSDARADDNWIGRRGLVHAAALDDHPRLQDFDVYASGPPAMVEAVRHEFTERGLPAQQLFFDSFDYAPDVLAKLSQ